MQPHLVKSDGARIPLDDRQYQLVLSVLGLQDASSPSMTPAEAATLLDEMEGISAGWGFSTDDLISERKHDRRLERRQER